MDHLTFDWDDDNIRHVAAHDVSPEEAEQAVNNSPYELGCDIREYEERVSQIGQTDSGRCLVVVTTVRGDRIRVVTSFPATRRQQELYRKAERSFLQ